MAREKPHPLIEAAMSIYRIMFISGLVANFAWSAAAQNSYSKSTEFPTLRISVLDLQEILNKASSLIEAANASAKTKVFREDIEIRNGDLKIKISGHRFEAGSTKLPKTFDVFHYNYSASDDSVIDSLSVDFRDYSRSLDVSGSSPDQVDAVFSAMRDAIQNLSTPIGGSGQRLVLGSVSAAILIYGLIGLISAYFYTRRKMFLLPAFLVGVLLILFFILPLGDVFAGFIAVDGDASFMVRYGPQLSFWGFMLGAVALPFTLLPLIRKNANTSNAATDEIRVTRKKKASKDRESN